MSTERREAFLWAAVAVLSLLLLRTAYLYNDLNNLFWQSQVQVTRLIAEHR